MQVNKKPFIFIAGLHRSGTSLLHEILKSHPQISGFTGTGVPEDEGQYLQTVYPIARKFGGPGKFAFDYRAYMHEHHNLATTINANRIYADWAKHLDNNATYWVEKSPPNLLKTRFLQRLFPGSKFIVVLRHPIAVAYATQKWSKTSIPSLLHHTLIAYRTFFKDRPALQQLHIIRYEELVTNPQKCIDAVFAFLELESITLQAQIKPGINQRYFERWEQDAHQPIPTYLELQANRCSYSLHNYEEPLPLPSLIKKTPLSISVVIPFYNTPLPLFKACIESVQRLHPYEIILVDDCSNDDELVKFASNQIGCVYCKTQQQSGYDGAPFNLGVRKATGTHICRVDSDDVLLELPYVMHTDILFGHANRVNVSMPITIEELILAPRAIFNASVVKREILLRYPQAEDANVYSDVLLVLQLLYHRHSFDVHPNINYLYRKREGSIQQSQQPLQHRLRHLQTVARFCHAEKVSTKEAEYFMQLAMLNLRYGSNSRRYLKSIKTSL